MTEITDAIAIAENGADDVMRFFVDNSGRVDATDTLIAAGTALKAIAELLKSRQAE